MKTYASKTQAQAAAAALNARSISEGAERRFHAGTTKHNGQNVHVVKRSALGARTVTSDERPECHAPSGYAHHSFSASNGARARQVDMILAFWESQGVARYNRRAGGVWEARDVVNSAYAGEWFPMAGQGEDTRADRIVFSHVRSVANDGAFCGCGVLPEIGAANNARGEVNMASLSPSALALVGAWEAWWRANAARPASLARL